MLSVTNLGRHNNEYSYLNALKGWAILAVLMVHTGASKLPGLFGRIGNDGARGVQLFFIISGMLTYKSLYRCFPDRKISFKGVCSWYLKKFLRLVPLYYLALAITMLTKTWSTFWLGTEDHVTVYNLFAHVFLMHGLFPHYTDSIIGVEWYLGVLWIFILLSPLLFVLVDSLETAIIIAVLVYIFNPILNSKLATILPLNTDSVVYGEYVRDFGPISEFGVYFLGGIAYFLIEYLKTIDFKYRKILSYSLFIFASILCYGLVNEDGNIYRFSRIEMFGVFFFIIVISQAIYSSKIIDNILCRMFGKYSYGIYLFQFIWLNLYNKYFNTTGVLAWAARFLSSVIVLLPLSIVLDRFYDKPLQRLFFRLNKKGQ